MIYILILVVNYSFAEKIDSLNVDKKPNILFISVDDLNDFPFFAGVYPDAITPNIDKLAQSGISFENAHTQYPMCGPSRSSVMSGLYPSKIPGKERIKDEKLSEYANEYGTKLLHQYFADYGYKTLAVGKLCHYHVPKGSVNESGGRGSFDAGVGRLKRNYANPKTNTDWAVVDKDDKEFPDYQSADWVINKLNQKHEEPFMLMVGFLRPHVPWYVTQKWYDLYDVNKIKLPKYKKDDLDDVPEISKLVNRQVYMPTTDWAIENNQWRNIMHAYLASTSFVDAQVGRVLDALKKSEYNENTIIVLWSDHGYHLGEKNVFQKHTLWERSSHVPLIFSGPGIPKGSRNKQPVGLIDVYPTLVELSGIPVNIKNDGHSLLPLINNSVSEWPFDTFTMYKKGNYAIQSDRYRYIRYNDGAEELYDHKNDKDEWKNLVGKKKFEEVRKILSLKLDSMKFKDSEEW